jgi:N-acyl-D-aspartate/D-glutamate deacylase
MCRDAEASMAAGAIGLSSGLEYIPGAYASIDELSAIAKVVASAGGFYATHLRDEGDHLEAAVEEAISVASNVGISLQLSHHKADLRRNWTAVRRTLARVTEAQANGIDIHIDQYPYTAYQTSLQTIVLPRWANAADSEALAELINTPGNRERIHAEMSHHDWSRIKIATCATHPDYIGMSLETLAANTGQHPQDFVLDLLATPGPWISAVHHAMSDEDVEYVLQDPRVMIGSPLSFPRGVPDLIGKSGRGRSPA